MIGNEPECTTGAELEVRYLHAPVDATDHQAFFAPVELECFAEFKFQGDEGTRRVAFALAPIADEISDPAIAACVAVCLDLGEQCFAGTPILLVAMGIGFERLFQRLVKRGYLKRLVCPAVPWRGRFFSASEPSAYRIAR